MKFDVIYSDCPWRYDFSKKTADSIEAHYPTMDIEDIASLSVPCASNSVLFLWATAPKLSEAMYVMESWGFTYKTNIVWDKCVIGLGYWSRVQHEHLLIGTRGKFSPPAYEFRESSVYKEKKGKHSRKPDHIRDWIDKSYSGMSKLELFGRDEHPGWITVGNAIDGEDITVALAKLMAK
jgi:N6-adenosine-specific RNA methylase IME4